MIGTHRHGTPTGPAGHDTGYSDAAQNALQETQTRNLKFPATQTRNLKFPAAPWHRRAVKGTGSQAAVSAAAGGPGPGGWCAGWAGVIAALSAAGGSAARRGLPG